MVNSYQKLKGDYRKVKENNKQLKTDIKIEQNKNSHLKEQNLGLKDINNKIQTGLEESKRQIATLEQRTVAAELANRDIVSRSVILEQRARENELKNIELEKQRELERLAAIEREKRILQDNEINKMMLAQDQENQAKLREIDRLERESNRILGEQSMLKMAGRRTYTVGAPIVAPTTVLPRNTFAAGAPVVYEKIVDSRPLN